MEKTQKERFMELMDEMNIKVEENPDLRDVCNYYHIGDGAACIGFNREGKKVYFHGGYE